jgi:CheY-like chemotaxis protein
MAATELLRSRMNTAFDPKVIEAFFAALRDETYVDRLEGGQTGAKILVIDGDPSTLSVCEMRLAAAGFQVMTAADGARGFEMICSQKPDVVVADTVLPKLDGISMLLKMRRMPEVKGIPVVFCSSRTEQGLLNKALKLGAKDVLAKPVNYQILLAKLRALSSMKQGQAQQSGGAAQGNLQDMPLTDFFRVISIGRKTCKVSVSGPAGKAEIFFEQGSPVAAYTATERGREAFATVVTWTEGSFGMTIGETAPEHNLDRGLETLIMQGGF